MTSELADLDAALPSVFPVLPRATVSGAYVLGGSVHAPRGDGFKVFCLPDGRLAAAVCDAPGSGALATQATARVLAVLRGALDSGAEAEQAVAAVNAYAARSHGTSGASLTLAVVDLTTGTLDVACAGQVAPLLCAPDGTARPVPLAPSHPLGWGGRASAAHEQLAEQASLLLHTTGLLTARGRALDRAAEDLRAAVEDLFVQLRAGGDPTVDDVDRVCHGLLSSMQEPRGYRDDVAALMVARRSPPEPHVARFPATPGRLLEALAALDVWLGVVGAGLLDRISLRQAVHELGTNAIRHAYLGTAPGDVEVRAALHDTGAVEVLVADTGRWRDPGPAHGQGLVLAGGLVEELHLERGPGGTRVTLRQRLGRPVPLLGSLTSDGVDATAAEGLSWHGEGSTLVVEGAVSEETVEEFAVAVHERTRAGLDDCVVDLDQVTHLCASGVVVLFDAARRARTSGSRFSLRCGPTTAAGLAVHRVGLDHLQES